MKIAVYSGSFNPLHEGHLAILEYLSKAFDGTCLVVSPQNPFKDASNRANADERLKAARRILESRPELNAKAEDIELAMPAPQYTIRTLDALRAREPDNDFTLVVGADCLLRFREWREYRRILLEYGLLVFPRPGYEVSDIIDSLRTENPLYMIEYAADGPLVDISSTRIRESSGRN